MRLNKNAEALLKSALASETLPAKLILECWNAERPHFGGAAGHRYDGNSRTCAYCFRPKTWKPVNAGYHSSCLAYGYEDEP